MDDSTKHDLAARLARGEEAAFAELYDACADGLYRYVSMRLGSADTAADIVQSAFMRAVKSRRRFRRVENPVGYLFHIARNEVYRLAKRQRTTQRPLATLNKFVEGGMDTSTGSDDAEVVSIALDRLTADDRELVELKIFGGLTFREIGDVTGMPQATVATRYRRALESLRPWLAKQLR